jgi:hypothetical protein
MPCLENLMNRNVNTSPLNRGVGVSIHDITVLDNVPKVRRETN